MLLQETKDLHFVLFGAGDDDGVHRTENEVAVRNDEVIVTDDIGDRSVLREAHVLDGLVANPVLRKEGGLDHDDLLIIKRERLDEGFRVGFVLDGFGKEVSRRDNDIDAKFLIKVDV